MTTTVQAVHDHLQLDPALADVLFREIANLRRTARWLIEENGWEDTTEEAVVSGLRRYRQTMGADAVWGSRGHLSELRLELRDGLALVSLPGRPSIREDVLDAWLAEHSDGPLGVLPGQASTQLLVEERAVSALNQALPVTDVADVESPVAVLRLIAPSRVPTHSFLALMLTALGHNGIEILELISSEPEWLIVVADEQLLEAHRIAATLTDQPITRPG